MGSRAALSLSKLLQRSRLPHFLLPRSAPIPPPPAPLPLLSLTLRSHVPSLGFFNTCWGARGFSYGSANLVLPDGKPRFEIHEIDQPSKEKYQTKKRLKLQRKRDKRKRKEANKADPRRIRPKGKKKDRFPSQEDRIKYKIEKVNCSTF